jgi:hypothetical protein|tara:strand:+ start:842 stop:3094 length:2253 start_codon:yes stop_codon:yes gene_type:complete
MAEFKEVSVENVKEYNKVILSKEPQVFTIDNFVSDSECDYLINYAKPKLTRAFVSDEKKGTVSRGRTGMNCWIPHSSDPVALKVSNQMSELIGVPLCNAEAMQVVYYDIEQKYDSHYDGYIKDSTPKNLRCLRMGGQRIFTCFLYLNNVKKGGSTRFNNLNLNIEPKKGKVLVWSNCYENTTKLHPDTLHAGCPVLEGEKYAINIWFREANVKIPYTYTPIDTVSDIKKRDEVYSIELNSSNNNILHEPISQDPYITHLKSIFTHEECDFLIRNCTNGKEQGQRRISHWINLKSQTMKPIVEKIANVFQILPEYYENMNIIEYNVGSLHGCHFDAFDLTSQRGITENSSRGQRVYTMIGMLSSSEYDGFIKFTNLPDKAIICNKGNAIVYKNVLDYDEKIGNQRDERLSYNISQIKKEKIYLFYLYVRDKNYNGEKLDLETLKNVEIHLNNSFLKNGGNPNDLKRQLDAINKNLNLINNTINVPKKPQPQGPKATEIVNDNEDFIKTLNEFYSKINSQHSICVPTNSLRFRRCNTEMDILTFKELSLIRESNNNSILNHENFDKKFFQDEFNPLIIEDVFLEEAMVKIRKYFHNSIDNNKYSLGDGQSNRYKCHNDVMSRIMHYEALPIIEHALGKKMVPTYTYLSCYIKGCDLPPHTDRPDCEYTISFIIDKPEGCNWPIYVDKTIEPLKSRGRYRDYDFKRKENCILVDCRSNGLMMFNGIDHIHFRDVLEGDYYYITLLHYRTKIEN